MIDPDYRRVGRKAALSYVGDPVNDFPRTVEGLGKYLASDPDANALTAMSEAGFGLSVLVDQDLPLPPPRVGKGGSEVRFEDYREVCNRSETPPLQPPGPSQALGNGLASTPAQEGDETTRCVMIPRTFIFRSMRLTSHCRLPTL